MLALLLCQWLTVPQQVSAQSLGGESQPTATGSVAGSRLAAVDRSLTTLGSALRAVCDGKLQDTTLGESSCADSRSIRDQLRQRLSSQPNQRQTQVQLMEAVSEQYSERILVYPRQEAERLLQATRSLCGCAGPLASGACGPARLWKRRFKIMLALGWTEQEILKAYAGAYRVDVASVAYRQDTGFSWILPIGAALVLLVVGVGLAVMRRRRPRRATSGEGDTSDHLTAKERERLEQELEKLDD